MNKDQAKGTAKEIAGKVQAKVGKAIGSTEQQVKGHAKALEGQAQQVVGDVKATLKDMNKKA